MPNLNPALIKLIIILLIAGSGIIRWIFIKLQEQAAKKRAQEELERRSTEVLRTGRDAEADGTSDLAAERARVEAEAAARRQAQIDEFRRRQHERARQRAEAQRGSVPIPPTPQAPAPQQAPAPKPQRPAKVAASPRPAPAAPRGPRQLLVPSAPEPETTHRLVTPAQEKPARAARGGPAFNTPQTPEQWRRAIIMTTLLSPPPGLGEGSDPWAPVSYRPMR